MPETDQTLDTGRLSPEAEGLRQFLAARLVGQERAVNHVVSRFELFQSPLREVGRPALKSLFLGPSGCGKTYLVECLAEFLFENPQALTKIDCGQLTSQHEVTSTLIGAPPGYVGFGQPARLSAGQIESYAWQHRLDQILRFDPDMQKLRHLKHLPTTKRGLKIFLQRKEREMNELAARKINESGPVISVILFDEFEKADKALPLFLYGPFDKARVQLLDGGETDLSRSFIFMTANIAAKEIGNIVAGRSRVGFSPEDKAGDSVYQVAIRETRKIFEPAFLGRLDDVVAFRPLTKAELLNVFDLELARLRSRLAELPVELAPSPVARDFIFRRATDHPELGARLIREKVEHYLREPMSRLINSGQIAKGDRVLVEVNPSNDGLTFSKGQSSL